MNSFHFSLGDAKSVVNDLFTRIHIFVLYRL